ncbi:cytochrome P450 [Pleomassaria siparia CBS 279.74]|uniref:Cytochrome P450 n=1 Tax=Pleomassaria siparia CBS 279.74 TaxID=1314801 RepID=A0A6G1KH75_9PLEO|nr:cytochrome P450 [Pleomassaria siparia CBS 279.74]
MAQHAVFFVAGSAFFLYILYTRLALYLSRRAFKKQNGCQPNPYVFNKDPILGIDNILAGLRSSKTYTVLEDTQNKYKDLGSNTFHSRLATMPVIMTTEPENIKTILSLKFKDYSLGAREKAFKPLLGHGIFNSDGERWANSRHLLRPNFARDQVADLDAFERHFKLMLKHVPKDGSTVDLQELFFRLTIDSATEFLFNHSTNSLRMVGQDEADNEDVIFSKAFGVAQNDTLTRIRLSFMYRFTNQTEARDAVRICVEYVDKWVDDAVRWRQEKDAEKAAGGEKDEERYLFIHELAKQTSDKARIRDELMNVLLAGRDTTASLLSNMFFELAKQPELWKRLREEIAVLDGRLPTYEELRNFKLLKWCLNESLRLHPVVAANSRLAIKDTVLPLGGGSDGKTPLFVPRGTLISYTTYAMHRREDLYGPDAHLYKPDRWANLRPGWEYLPFNGGPRICLGQQYALTEAGFVTARLVQEFAKMESRDDGPWKEGLTLTCCSLNGTKVGLFN